MPIFLKRPSGKVTEFKNAEYIPAFYFIPKSILNKCGKEYSDIPRNPRKLMSDRRAISFIESDAFRLLIIDAYAFMAWWYMGIRAPMEIFSGYDPMWIFAHSPSQWVNEMVSENIIPLAEEFLKDGGPDEEFGYISEEEISGIFSWLVPKVMVKYDMYSVFDYVSHNRCFEDFDKRDSNLKKDLFRKWYHTRAALEIVSYEKYFEKKYGEDEDKENDLEDEDVDVQRDVTAKVFAEDFLKTLSEKDKKILELRMEGHTLEEVAKLTGFKNHSGVLKRIKKLGAAFEKYAGVDYGFTNNT